MPLQEARSLEEFVLSLDHLYCGVLHKVQEGLMTPICMMYVMPVNARTYLLRRRTASSLEFSLLGIDFACMTNRYGGVYKLIGSAFLQTDARQTSENFP